MGAGGTGPSMRKGGGGGREHGRVEGRVRGGEVGSNGQELKAWDIK